MLFAEGKESTEITVSESTGSGSSSSSSNTTTRTCSETNTFYSEDISHLLQKSVSSNILEDGILEILPQNREIAFEFVLPSDNNLLSSYKGKHANITYTVKATADIAKRLDVNKEKHFFVFNLNNNKVLSSSVNEENKQNTAVTDTVENKENNLPSPSSLPNEDTSKESYTSRFERIFGKKLNRNTTSYRRPSPRYFTFSGTGLNINLGSIFAKSREHFLKENSKARIDLLNNNDNDLLYSPGHIVKGKVILLAPQNQEEKKTSRKMKITLSGIEHAFAQGLQRVTTIEKYETHIELAENGGHNDNSSAIPFEFQIPENINQSYTGKYSEYFWGLEAKLNIAWSSDIYARTIIEIV
ncbi:MAG TPA: hypothetical protein VFS97_05295 [Nitrososphaeraceae archaeon]|nr:hypothetical protein [Nitrososphaeraceae archaeon]